MKQLNYSFCHDFSLEEQALLAPKRQTELASGFDLASCSKSSITLMPNERCLVPTGVRIELLAGFEGQIRSRSGLSLKHGVVVLNSPGTIDADYRGELKIILANFSNEPFVVEFGMRIAQLVVCPVLLLDSVKVENMSQTTRAQEGFGSTGMGVSIS